LGPSPFTTGSLHPSDPFLSSTKGTFISPTAHARDLKSSLRVFLSMPWSTP
jgi:hypothetical protein